MEKNEGGKGDGEMREMEREGRYGKEGDGEGRETSRKGRQ